MVVALLKNRQVQGIMFRIESVRRSASVGLCRNKKSQTWVKNFRSDANVCC